MAVTYSLTKKSAIVTHLRGFACPGHALRGMCGDVIGLMHEDILEVHKGRAGVRARLDVF